jgi:hypothetical protein
MALLNAGWWETTWWPSNYWHSTWWPKFGSSTPTVTQIQPVGPRYGRRRRREHKKRELLTLLSEYLKLKIGEENA